eukprot:INCI4062.1.p1 GENE.INCI4062.1~~INCI4062.1.p1  ORF type:complete len:448 (-),score=65.66 INCI4062.1:1694-3037(-)
MRSVASSERSTCSRLKVLAFLCVNVFCFHSTDAFSVSNCSQCITLDPVTSRVNATCSDDLFVGDGGDAFGFENTTVGSTCSCLRPYFEDPMWSGSNNSTSSRSPCKHAFEFSPALRVVEYSPAPLFLLVLVYACRVAHEKIAVVAQKRASATGGERGLRSKIMCICYPLIAATFLLIAGILTRVAYVSIDPMSVYRLMPAAVNDVLLRVGFQLVLLALLLVMDSWFLVLELLPKPTKTSLVRDDSLEGSPRGSDNGEDNSDDDSEDTTDIHRRSSAVVTASGCIGQGSCQTQCRRVGLWAAGGVTITLEVAGLYFAFDTGESNLPGLGFSAATLVQFATVVVWFVAMIAWGIAGFMLLRRLRSVSEEIPRVRALKRLLGMHLGALLALYIVYAALGILYPVTLSEEPVSFTITITLHRFCELCIMFSLLRIVDGTGDGCVFALSGRP